MELETWNADLEHDASVYKYTQEYGQVQEERYKAEIVTLKRQIESTSEARQYEYEVIFNQTERHKSMKQVGRDK